MCAGTSMSSSSSTGSLGSLGTTRHWVVGTVAQAGPLGRRRSSRRPSRSAIAGHLALPACRPSTRTGGWLGPMGKEGNGVDLGTATSAQPQWLRPPVPYRTCAALFSAGFRRYSTCRQATLAAVFTIPAVGFLNGYVLLAVAAGNGGSAAGYGRAQLATFVWVSQGMLGTVGLWGDTELA